MADLGVSPKEHQFHPALLALSDSGWDDGEDSLGFLKWEFQTRNYHAVIMDASVSDTSWDLIKSTIDSQLISLLE